MRGSNLIKVLVVDDSALMRKLLSEMLSSDNEIDVVSTAKNGVDALNKVRSFNPDVITLDLEMPEKDGLETLKELRLFSSVPVLIVSAASQADKTFKALDFGAFDFVEKPSGQISLDIEKIKQQIIDMVKLAFNSVRKKVVLEKKSVVHTSFNSSRKKVVVIASSTGGPQTLEALLTQLPGNLPAPILVVQHMPVGFTSAFAERLNRNCEISVREAKDGEELENGVVFIAPAGFHMELKSDIPGFEGFISLNKLPSELGVRPCANRLFNSVANIFKENTIGIVLTGMGNDGTLGSKTIKSFNGLVISQSEKTSIIYGMPKSVADANLSDMVLDLDKIPVALLQAIDV